jgi:phospholipid transport system substrate-binding protein
MLGLRQLYTAHARSQLTTLIVAACTFTILLQVPSYAQKWLKQDSEDLSAESFIQGLANEAVDILDNEAVPLDVRKQKFSGLVLENTDIPAIGYFTLGRYRRTASSVQLEDFLTLFQQYTVNFYESRLGFYSGQRLEVTGSIKRGDKDIVVTSILRMGSAEQPAPVNWRLRKENKKYIIRDMELFGVWLAIEQRSQFTSVISNNGGRIAALLDRLRDRIASGDGLSAGSAPTQVR